MSVDSVPENVNAVIANVRDLRGQDVTSFLMSMNVLTFYDLYIYALTDIPIHSVICYAIGTVINAKRRECNWKAAATDLHHIPIMRQDDGYNYSWFDVSETGSLQI